jgi:hypothetical protein
MDGSQQGTGQRVNKGVACSASARVHAAGHYLGNAPHQALDKTAFSLVFALYISPHAP